MIDGSVMYPSLLHRCRIGPKNGLTKFGASSFAWPSVPLHRRKPFATNLLFRAGASHLVRDTAHGGLGLKVSSAFKYSAFTA